MRNKLTLILLILSVATIGIGFWQWIFVPYHDMYRWLNLSDKIRANPTMEHVDMHDTVFTHKSLATGIIVTDFLDTVFKNQKVSAPLIPTYENAISVAESYQADKPQYPNVSYLLARTYDTKYTASGDPQWLIFAKNNYEKALKIFPERQEYIYPFTFNMFMRKDEEKALQTLTDLYEHDQTLPENNFYLGVMLTNLGESKYGQALAHMEDALNAGFEVVDTSAFSDTYTRIFYYFYKKKDLVNLEKITFRLSTVENPQKELFGKIHEYIKATNKIPDLKFEEQ